MQNIKEKFHNWLTEGNAKKLSPAVCIICMESVSAWAIRKNYSKVGFWEIIEEKVFNAIRIKLGKDKTFKFSDGKNYKTFERVGLLYLQFLKDMAEVVTEATAVIVEETKDEIAAFDIKNGTGLQDSDLSISETTLPQNKMTIVEAVIEVLKQRTPLTFKQIYQEIIDRELYTFGAANPIGVVANTIRRHCLDFDYPRSADTVIFFIVARQEEGKNLIALINTKTAAIKKESVNVVSFNGLEWNDTVARNFMDYIVQQGKAPNTAASYKSGMNWVVNNFTNLWNTAQLKGVATKAVYFFIQQIQKDEKFIEANATMHNQYSAALNQFLNFVNNAGDKGFSPEVEPEVEQKKLYVRKREKHSAALKEFADIFMTEYSNGFDFSVTAIRLLSGRIGFEMGDNDVTTLKSLMFCRSDNIYFWPTAIATDEVNSNIIDKALAWLNKFGCFEVSRLYEVYKNSIPCGIIRHHDDFFAYFAYISLLDTRDFWFGNHRIIAIAGTKKNQIEPRIANALIDAIKESGGSIPEYELAEQFPIISDELIGDLLKWYARTVIKTEINDLLCYQSLDSLGLPDDFSKVLSAIIVELAGLGLAVTEESLHTALSLKLNMNFREEYNLQKNKTYRQLISAYYDDKDGQAKREWNRGVFSVVNGGTD